MTKLPDPDCIAAGLGLPGAPAATRIVVAMSGGVDSSVAAGLLTRAGYDVVGVTLQLYDHGEAEGRPGACCAGRDIHDARRVAAHLGIPHYVLDYEERFRTKVIDAFADSYIAGETPIPCVTCNQTVKFTDLLATAGELGAAVLATGHYIASKDGGQGRELHRPVDETRDQSYFLFATTRDQLERVRFPLGGYTKDEVRGFAAALGLAIAEKPDSQDICFVPKGHYTDVLEKLRPGAAEPGEIVHLDGRVLGRHDGVVRFTVGQRKGLGIATGEPLFVVRIDADKRRVVVGPHEALATTRIYLRGINWLGDGTLDDAAQSGMRLHARVRSTRQPRPAALRIDTSGGTPRYFVEFDEGDAGVAPGQACVFYSSGEGPARVLGGGFIAETGAPHAPATGSRQRAREPVTAD